MIEFMLHLNTNKSEYETPANNYIIYLKNFNQILTKQWSQQMYEWQFQENPYNFTSIKDKRLLIWE